MNSAPQAEPRKLKMKCYTSGEGLSAVTYYVREIYMRDQPDTLKRVYRNEAESCVQNWSDLEYCYVPWVGY